MEVRRPQERPCAWPHGGRGGGRPREREAIPSEVKRRVMAGDARGSGSPSPHGGCATPRAGRPRGREATVQMHGQRDRVRDALGSGSAWPHGGRRRALSGTPVRERERMVARAGYGGTPARHAGSRGAAWPQEGDHKK